MQSPARGLWSSSSFGDTPIQSTTPDGGGGLFPPSFFLNPPPSV